MKEYLFSSESVAKGHPDKLADQISDALLDNFLAYDPSAKVAVETLVTTGQVVLAGEVHSDTYVDVDAVTRDVIRRVGYDREGYFFNANSCGILSAIHEQSNEIRQGVDQTSIETQGAGDQGLVFGYAVKETDDTDTYMPFALDIAHRLMRNLEALRHENTQMPYLRPDAKAQVTVAYDTHHCVQRVHTIVLSTQNDPFHSDDQIMQQQIKRDVQEVLLPRMLNSLPQDMQRFFHNDIIYHINPTGKFVIGGPHGDSGLTGRKIIVDTYGGKGAHGGGAFSGKDPSKVDRSAAYMARYIAKHLVAAGIANQALVQIAYAIGQADPVSFYVNTYGTARNDLNDASISKRLQGLFDMRPGVIAQTLHLQTPIYEETASYGHMGRTHQPKSKTFNRLGEAKTMEVNLFPWEQLNKVEEIRAAFDR